MNFDNNIRLAHHKEFAEARGEIARFFAIIASDESSFWSSKKDGFSSHLKVIDKFTEYDKAMDKLFDLDSVGISSEVALISVYPVYDHTSSETEIIVEIGRIAA